MRRTFADKQDKQQYKQGQGDFTLARALKCATKFTISPTALQRIGPAPLQVRDARIFLIYARVHFFGRYNVPGTSRRLRRKGKGERGKGKEEREKAKTR